MDYEITAVEKPHGEFSHEQITAIGNNRDGWGISTLSAMRRLALRRDTFYIFDHVAERRVYLTTMRDKQGELSLRATLDGRATNHLLALRPLRDCKLID